MPSAGRRSCTAENRPASASRPIAIAIAVRRSMLRGARLVAAWAPFALGEVDDERDAVEAVSLSEAVLDEVSVITGDARPAVDLNGEARWLYPDLGHVEHLQPMSLLRRRLPRLADLPQEAVQLGRGDPVRAAGAERQRLLQQPAHVAPGHGARREHLRAQTQLAVDPRALAVQLGGTHAAAGPRDLLDVAAGQVPLVEHERGRAAGLHRPLGDPQVLRGHAVRGVADDERDVGPLGRPLRAQRRVVLDRLLHLGAAPDAGRVDQQQRPAVDLDRRVDRVARGAGDVGDDHALAAEEGVDEAGLADVRAADHGEADGLLVLLRGVVAVGQQLDQAVEQVARAQPLRGGDRQRIAEPEAVEVVHEPDVARVVDLVGRDDDGQAAAAQDVGDLRVAGAHARARVYDEQRDLRIGERLARLVLDRDAERVLLAEVDAAGVDQREAAAVPVGRELLAVARDAGALVDDRLARLREAVDQRRLPDVGIADDGDLHRSSLASTASVSICATTSSRLRPVVSTGTASTAGSSTLRSAEASRSSRSACSRSTCSASLPICAARRRARSSGVAVRNTFTAASGATTEPMSRPSATQSPSSTISCCMRTSAARTSGSAATREAPAETSGVRIASVTSRPSSSTRSPTRMSARPAISAACSSRPAEASATARYIAPVSRYVNPSRSATARATVDFPAPAGPSMAITMASEARWSLALPCAGR